MQDLFSGDCTDDPFRTSSRPLFSQAPASISASTQFGESWWHARYGRVQLVIPSWPTPSPCIGTPLINPATFTFTTESTGRPAASTSRNVATSSACTAILARSRACSSARPARGVGSFGGALFFFLLDFFGGIARASLGVEAAKLVAPSRGTRPRGAPASRGAEPRTLGGRVL